MKITSGEFKKLISNPDKMIGIKRNSLNPGLDIVNMLIESGFALDLSNLILPKINLRKANLVGLDFTNTTLIEADLVEAKLENAVFKNVNAINANFEGANLNHADFEGAKLTRANFSFANLTTATFRNANAREANFEAANLNSTKFEKCKLIDANLKRVQHADFSGAIFKIVEAKLENSIFKNVEAIGANFNGAEVTTRISLDQLKEEGELRRRCLIIKKEDEQGLIENEERKKYVIYRPKPEFKPQDSFEEKIKKSRCCGVCNVL